MTIEKDILSRVPEMVEIDTYEGWENYYKIKRYISENCKDLHHKEYEKIIGKVIDKLKI